MNPEKPVIKTVTGAVGNTRRRYANTRRLFVITVGRRGTSLELFASHCRHLENHRRGRRRHVYYVFPLRSKKYDPIYITIIVNGAPLLMEVDTGATLSVISKATYDRAWREELPPLAPSTARLRTYTGEEIPVKGEIEVDVCHRDQQKRLTLIVTEGNGPSLHWLTELRLNWKTTYQVRNSSALAAVLDDHKEIFRNELGTITCVKAEIHVDPQVPPSFHRPRPVPFALKQKVLERLEKEGIIRPRKFTVGGANRGSTQERWVGSTLRRLQGVSD